MKNGKKVKVIIIGAGGHARVVSSILNFSDYFEVVGFIDETINSKGEKVGQLSVLGDHKLLPDLLKQGISNAIVALGDNKIRAKRFYQLVDLGFNLINAIHPKALIESGVRIGRGNVIAAGAIIGCYTEIGDNCIINTGATIDHEAIIQDHIHIAPGSHIAGRVRIGPNTFIGIGANIKDYITIGANVTVGAGAAVVKDIPDNNVVVGVPARQIKSKK